MMLCTLIVGGTLSSFTVTVALVVPLPAASVAEQVRLVLPSVVTYSGALTVWGPCPAAA
jgi:hypothetical protein